VGRNHRACEFRSDVLHLRNERVRRDGDESPKHDDRDGKQPNRSRDDWPTCPMPAHADFTLHVTSASWRVADCSSRTTPLTNIRQCTSPPCTCAEMLPE